VSWREPPIHDALNVRPDAEQQRDRDERRERAAALAPEDERTGDGGERGHDAERDLERGNEQVRRAGRVGTLGDGRATSRLSIQCGVPTRIVIATRKATLPATVCEIARRPPNSFVAASGAC
jgi:hypothetical protein